MKSFKRLGVLAGVLILIGCVLIGIGFANGGSIAHKGFGFYLSNGTFMGMNFGQDSPDEQNAKKTQTFTFDNITDLDVSVDVGDLTVLYDDTAQNITIECKNVPDRYIKQQQSNQSLEFEVNSPSVVFAFNSSMPKYDVIVTLPSHQKLNSLKLDSDTGKVIADKLIADAMELSSDTGKVEVGELSGNTITLSNDTGKLNVNKVVCKKLSIDSDTGFAEINGIDCEQMSAESDTGRMKLSGKISKLIDLESDTGSIDLALIGKEDQYGFQISNDIGSVNFGSRHFGMEASQTMRVASGAMVNITNDVGKITVTFRDK